MPRKNKQQLTVQPDDEGFYRLHEVLHLIPVSERTWWRGIAAGLYPKPVKISPQISGWRKRGIRRLCEELAAREAS